MAFADFGYTNAENLDLIDAAMAYAIRATNSRLYETGIHSPFRFLTEAQAYVYNQFLYELQTLDIEFEQLIFNLMGFSARSAQVGVRMLRIEIGDPARNTTGLTIDRGFPVKSPRGEIYKTDRNLAIPALSGLGFVAATALNVGSDEGLTPGTPMTPLKPIAGVDGLRVTVDQVVRQGSSGESVGDLQKRLAEYLRHNCLSGEDDFKQWIASRYPNAATTITSPTPGMVHIITTGADGQPLGALLLDRLRTELQKKLKMGIRVHVDPMTIKPLDITVIAAMGATSTNYEALADELIFLARDYFRPIADWQQYGTVLITELLRLFGKSSCDYVQTVTVGDAGQVQHGNNYIFEPSNTRVYLENLTIEITAARRSQTLQGFSAQSLYSKTVAIGNVGNPRGVLDVR